MLLNTFVFGYRRELDGLFQPLFVSTAIESSFYYTGSPRNVTSCFLSFVKLHCHDRRENSLSRLYHGRDIEWEIVNV